MSEDAYRIIAENLIAVAPRPFETVEAQFRIHDAMFQSQCAALRADGKRVGFPVRGQAFERIRAAVGSLRETLPHGAGPAFTRADFRLGADGRFNFDAYYAPQLLDKLVAVLRARWPQGVERLRLSAHRARGDEQGWQLEFFDVGAGAAPRALPRPRATTDFDTPRWLITDLAQAAGRSFTRFEMELARSGDYAVTLDGEPFVPR